MADELLTGSYDFVQKAVGEVAEQIKVLARRLQDDEIRKLVLADLGLDPNSGAQLDIPEQNLNSINDYLERTDTDVDAFLAIVDDVIQIVEAVTSFIETASADPTTEDALREMTFELIMLSSLLQYRYKAPAALAIAEIFGVIDYGLENYDLTRLLFDQLGRVLGLLGKIFQLDDLFGADMGDSTAFQTEAHARDFSDLILLPLGAFLFYLDCKEKPTSKFDFESLYGWDILDTDEPTSADLISDRILSTNIKWTHKGKGEKLFSLSQDLAGELNNREISAALRSDFANNGQGLANTAVVSVKEADKKWHVVDTKTYTIKKEDGSLNVYSQPVKHKLSVAGAVALVPIDDGGPGIFIAIGGAGERTVPLSTDWSLKLKSKSATAGSMFLKFKSPDVQFFGPGDFGLTFELKRKDKYLQRRARLPDVKGTKLSFGAVDVGLEISTKKVELRTTTKNNTLIISGKSADSFIRSSLPAGEIRADFDVGVAYDVVEQKFRFTDGTKLKVVLPLGKEVLGVRFVYITLEVAPISDDDETRLGIEVSGSLSIKWGPFTSAIDRIGLLVTLPPPKDSSDDRDWSKAFDFKPPTGVGFAIDSPGAVTGGGFLFFDRDNEEYAGVLQLAIAEKVDVKAVGLITTKLEDDKEGFSILAIASVEFTPGVQLVWGFALEGVGLLVGVNRSMVLDVLRSGVRNGTLDAILFPDDPVRNAPKIINDLRSVFPSTDKRHVFGFLLFISWAGLKNSFKLKLGVALEVPSPVKLAIMGQLELRLPSKKLGVVLINCDIVGIWDQAEKSITVDAALRDSKVGQFPLTGELALRGNWGNEPAFILAAGGVHPGFNPPAALPKLKRVEVALGTSDNPRVRMQGYVAVTSNTFQVGARAELNARAKGFSLEGWAGIDTLFTFDPFEMVADFSAGVKIKRGSRVLFSLTLKATLSGFTPIRIRGKVKFKIFFVKFTIPVRLTLGSPLTATLAPVNVLNELTVALGTSTNWAGELAGQRQTLVTLRDTPSADELMVHPVAALSVRQQVVPLGLEIQVYKNARPSGDRRFDITKLEVNGKTVIRRKVADHFAPAQFFDMSDDEKLARPSFEKLPAGVTAGDDSYTHGPVISSDLTYETILIDRGQNRLIRLPDYDLSAEVFEASATFGAAAEGPPQTSGAGKYRVPGLGIRVSEPEYGVAGTDDLVASEAVIETGSYSQALAALRSHEANNRGAAGRLQVVGLHERATV